MSQTKTPTSSHSYHLKRLWTNSGRLLILPRNRIIKTQIIYHQFHHQPLLLDCLSSVCRRQTFHPWCYICLETLHILTSSRLGLMNYVYIINWAFITFININLGLDFRENTIFQEVGWKKKKKFQVWSRFNYSSLHAQHVLFYLCERFIMRESIRQANI